MTLARLALATSLLSALLPAASRAQVPPAPSPEAVAEALAAYEHEPRLDELVEAVSVDPAYDPARARQVARRARRGGWLPQLRVGVRRGQQRDLSAQIEDEETRISTDDDLVLDASLTFRFDRAAYGPNEVGLLREERQRALLRDERVRLVVKAFYERRRLQLERDLLGARDPGTLLRIRELEALLDAFTSGAFTRILGTRGGARRPRRRVGDVGAPR